MVSQRTEIPLRQIKSHPRGWRANLYVYPVISRRSRGLSIGVNLNPDTACNFDCIYCQVDRSGTPRVRDVDPARLAEELKALIATVQDGSFFEDAAFRDVSGDWRQIRDIAFSGDGEPTTCKHFSECVDIVASLKREAGLKNTKIILITDACYLTRPSVVAGLAVMDANEGEIWAKLDAGTEDYYRTINRPNAPLQHVIDNIIAAARVRPLVIQSLFMNVHGQGPDDTELHAFADRLNEITRAGGSIDYVQVYTIARRPAESYVSPLADSQVDDIARLIHRRTGLRANVFYGVQA